MFEPIGKQKPLLRVPVTEGVAVQLSVAVGAVQVAAAHVVEVVKLIFAGHADSTGGIASVAQPLAAVTTTVKLHIDVLLRASVAV